ncbi:MAG: hypothetical protein H6706_24315 [Myxococcales bacterium]|nr:hypothetical protein [Myxococcales bacterium]
MRTTLLALLGLVAACDGGESGPAPRVDAAPPDAALADAAPPDAGDASTRLQCTCAAGPEDCGACLRLIGRCCLGDETFGGRLAYLQATCQENPACAACCDECAARDCAAVRASGDCPTPPEDAVTP